MPVISQDLTDSIYRGTTEISAVYRGSKLIWERDTTPPEPVITYKYYFSIDNTGSVIMRGNAIMMTTMKQERSLHTEKYLQMENTLASNCFRYL